jgi:hypothetical protein
MSDGRALLDPVFHSPLASVLQRFLEGKRAAGYRYRAGAEGLRALDRFLVRTLQSEDPVITKAIVREFVHVEEPNQKQREDIGWR